MVDGWIGLLTPRGQTHVSHSLLQLLLNSVTVQHRHLRIGTFQLFSGALEGRFFSLLTFTFHGSFLCFCPWFHTNCIFRVSGRCSAFRLLPSRPVMLHAAASPFSSGTRPRRASSRLCPGACDRRPARVGWERKHAGFCLFVLLFFPRSSHQTASVEAAPPFSLNSASVERLIRQMTFLPLTAGGYYLNY